MKLNVQGNTWEIKKLHLNSWKWTYTIKARDFRNKQMKMKNELIKNDDVLSSDVHIEWYG